MFNILEIAHWKEHKVQSLRNASTDFVGTLLNVLMVLFRLRWPAWRM